jgi:hypothetical protein
METDEEEDELYSFGLSGIYQSIGWHCEMIDDTSPDITEEQGSNRRFTRCSIPSIREPVDG